MAIVTLNIDGIHGHFDEVQNMLVDLDAHILALNETKARVKHCASHVLNLTTKISILEGQPLP